MEQRRFAKELRKNQTVPEQRLWHELRARRLDGWKFRRQVPIEGYVADFVCFEARLIVEMDGPLHRTPERQQKRTPHAMRFSVDGVFGRSGSMTKLRSDGSLTIFETP
jgi:very-short-patch-repair endonuclease